MLRKGIALILIAFMGLIASARAMPGHRSWSYTAVADTAKKKPGLLKRLSDALKFRKNAITKEQERVTKIIDRMIKQNSGIATAEDLDSLRREMTEANKLQLDMLLALIKEIRIPENTAETPENPEGVKAPAKGKQPFEEPKELDPNEKYINELIDQVGPAPAKEQAEKAQKKSRRQELRPLRSIIYENKNSITDTINDSTAIRYRIKLTHRAEVIGRYQFDKGYVVNKYNLRTLTGLSYDSYELDPFSGKSKIKAKTNDFNSWSNTSVIPEASEAGAKIYLTVTTQSSLETAKFLTSEAAKKEMIGNTLNLLESRNADGINIAFKGLSKQLNPYFIDFIRSLSVAYRAKPKQFQVTITLPAFDQAKAYDLLRLDPLVDRFVIDFSKKPDNFPGPVAPLADDSNYSIESSVSRYLNTGIAPYKFILGLSYYGVEFSLNKETGVETYKRAVPYSEIRQNYQHRAIIGAVTYDEKAAFASVETLTPDGEVTGHIYYDNDASLEQKYDFVLENGLGGVSIWHLGADDGYGELWDALSYKFLKADTISQDTIVLKKSGAKQDHSFFGYIKRNLVAYYHALESPCDTAYDQPDTLLLTIFNIFLGLISVITAVILLMKIKEKGEKWEWKKTLIRVLIVSVNLFIITIFMWLYIDNSIPWFGASEDCIDMPFSILLLIIFTGIVLGTLIMRFLIFPVLQRDEKP